MIPADKARRHIARLKYPERVFYTRRWIDPDGKVFGKPKLRITTASAFTRMCNGYRQPFQVVSERA